MQIINKTHYTITFPKRQTRIIAHNPEDQLKIQKILTLSQIEFNLEDSHSFNISSKTAELLEKIDALLNERANMLSEHKPTQILAKLIQNDLKTSILIKSL